MPTVDGLAAIQPSARSGFRYLRQGLITMTYIKTTTLASLCALAFASTAYATECTQSCTVSTVNGKSTYTYNLDSAFMNVGGVTKAVLAPSSYGKVIIADDLNDTKAVKFTIDLTGTGQKIQEVDFNTVAALASATFAATAVDGSSTTLTVANKQDAVQADGYTTGKFDVEMPKNGSFGNVVELLSFVLKATNLDLDASNFLALDTNGSLYFDRVSFPPNALKLRGFLADHVLP
ncbi:MAG: hypothetical protein ACJ8AI_08720 [Rhodopila sp.]